MTPSGSSSRGPRERVATIFAYAILGVWVVVAIVSLLIADYRGLGLITPALMLAAGYAFGVKWLPNGKDYDRASRD